ncbi:MAG: inositol monophosphatase family protein [Caldilineaceae bacterium]
MPHGVQRHCRPDRGGPLPDELNAYREFALATAREAGDLAVASFGHATAERKADGSLVTQVDKACDRLIARRIHAAYPSHAVLSEEQDTSYDPANTFTWVVDPIDGTTNYRAVCRSGACPLR